MSIDTHSSADASTGVVGLDDILGGGLARECVFLVEGNPGTGKTTLGLQFLIAGAASGERGLYITMSETEAELRQGAASHGWSLADQVHIVEIVPPESLLDPNREQTLLYSSDLELGETTRQIFSVIEQTSSGSNRRGQPVRVPPVGTELAALSAADPGAQAFLRTAAAPPSCSSMI